jgi:uncharacterized protein HemY
MIKILNYSLLTSLSISLILSACSTERNTLLSRSYHGLTAKYNGHWNAQELLKVSFKTFNDNYEDNFYELIPLEILPNATEVKGLYPAIDTAISKCTKVIGNHSMPTASKPWAKDVENNTWIDENWITIGESQYMRRDYDAALKSFEYISKFWKNDQSIYLAEVWKARTQLQLGNETEAIFSIAKVEKFLKEAEEENKSKYKKSTKSKSKSKKSKNSKNQKKETPPKPSKALKFGLYKAKTQLAIVQNDDKAASENLELALKNCKNKKEKGRLYYVLGQLYERQQQNDKAQECYKKVAKYPASYQIQFHARINRAIGGGEKVRKDLKKMLRDEKNLEFKDQIYYALAQLDMRENKENQAIEDYTLSASTSISNARQKGISYEALGDLSMKNRSYVSAQKYYDSCVQVLPKEFPRFEAISKKAEKLKELVLQVTIIEEEDSLQMIAHLSPDEREKFVKNEIKRIKAEEKSKKEKDAIRMQAIQDAQATKTAQAGGKGYWNNPKTKAEGIVDFKKLWGSRENEDNWRRSQKISSAIAATENDTLLNNSISTFSIDSDSLNVDNLLENVPIGDSAFGESNKRLIAALYNAGVIYTEQLQEDGRAFNYLDRAVKMRYEDKHRLLSSYKIYSMYRLSDDSKASENKNFILDKYPSSDYAGYLRDPNYFVKKKQIEALAGDDYVNTLERYNRKVYSIVITKADEVIDDQKENPYRSKYMLLKALAIGQTNEDKQLMIPALNAVISEYSETPEAKRAKELLNILKNGISENKPVDFSKPEIYSKKGSDIYYVCLFLPESENSNAAKIKVSDFNRDQYSAKGYKINSRIFGKQSMITIETFDKLELAKEYIDNFKSTKKNLGDLSKRKILLISKDNLVTLFGTLNLEEYESFLDDKY